MGGLSLITPQILNNISQDMIVDEGVDFNLDAAMDMYANDDFQLPDGAFGAVSPSPANILSSAGKTGRTNRKVCPV